MFDFFRAQEKQPGLTPGTLVYTGAVNAETPADLRYYVMGQGMLAPTPVRVAELAKCPRQRLWVDVAGDHDVNTIRQLGDLYQLHDLILEDVVNPIQRPKLETYPEGLFLVVQEPFFTEDRELHAHQIGFFLSGEVLLTFHRHDIDPFQPILARLQRGGGRLGHYGLDYLLYALFDMVVDRGFRVLAQLEDELDAVEEATIDMFSPQEALQVRINQLKKQLILVRRTLLPLKEVCMALMNPGTALIHEEIRVFLRDVTDHVHQLVEFVEVFRERLRDNGELYHTKLAQHTNKIMQTLGTIGGIFIPMTFIAGVYGMNFQFMPELGWSYGYPLALSLMGVTALGLFILFKKRHWL